MACANTVVVRATFWEEEEASLKERALLGLPRPRCFSDSWLDELDRLTESTSSEFGEAASVVSVATSEAADESPSSRGSCPRTVSWSDSADSDDEVQDRKRLSRREGHARRPDLWAAGEAEADEEADFTTLVLKNLPSGSSRADLRQLLEQEGFENAFNFLYVPMNFKQMKSFCYAFVNFVDHDTAVRALSHLAGFAWSLAGNDVRLEATWSQPHQGLQVHIERFRNSPVMHPTVPDDYKPILLQDGVRLDFPEPTAKVVAPRELRKQVRVAQEQ